MPPPPFRHRVLGLDRFPLAHDRGSSHGQTRLIRQAYFEHADYVPLLLRAYALWRDLEQRTSRRLLVESGLLLNGSAESPIIQGAERSATAGAALETGVTVRGWRADGAGIVVETDRGRIAADRLVLAAGAWAGDLLRLPAVELTVLRKAMFWVRSPPGSPATASSSRA